MLFDARREPVGLWAAYAADRTLPNRNAVAERYEWLVRRVALRYRDKLPRRVELDDLIQAGQVGLIDAIEKYDPAQNVRFTTYAGLRIWGAMVDDLRRMDWLPKLARQRGEHRPDVFSIDMPVPDHEGKPITVADCVADPSPGGPSEWDGWMESLAQTLPRRERFLILSYYRDEKPMHWIGAQLGIAESRVSQIHRDVCRELRRQLNPDGERKSNPHHSFRDVRVPVRCVETSETFPSISDAARSIGREMQAVQVAIRNGGRSGGYHWQRA